MINRRSDPPPDSEPTESAGAATSGAHRVQAGAPQAVSTGQTGAPLRRDG